MELTQLTEKLKDINNNGIFEGIKYDSAIDDELVPLVEECNHIVERLKNSEKKIASTEHELLNVKNKLTEFMKACNRTIAEPVRVASTYTDMLRRKKGKWDDDEKPYFNVIEDSHKQLDLLMKKFQDYCSVGVNEHNIREIEMKKLVLRIIDGFRQEIAGIDVRVTVDDLGIIKADTEHIKLLYHNIIENAIIYRGRKRRLDIHIGMSNKTGSNVFFVADNGMGIKNEHCLEIFNLFAQLSTHTKHPGSGLGLAICKNIVELYSGRIWAQSMPESGTIFYFTLNCAESH